MAGHIKSWIKAICFVATGVLHSNLHAPYSKELGDFITCVEDRFIIANYVLADETDSFLNSIRFTTALPENSKATNAPVRCGGGTVVLY